MEKVLIKKSLSIKLKEKPSLKVSSLFVSKLNLQLSLSTRIISKKPYRRSNHKLPHMWPILQSYFHKFTAKLHKDQNLKIPNPNKISKK